jgi:cycloeucalenol cycloisomerase
MGREIFSFLQRSVDQRFCFCSWVWYVRGTNISLIRTLTRQSFRDFEYLSLSLIISVPCVLYPLLFPGEVFNNNCYRDFRIQIFRQIKNSPLLSDIFLRYQIKIRSIFDTFSNQANIWIFLFGFVGNYFWTHYFFSLLGAGYTFPVDWKLNEIPIMLYLITHAYFISYHAVINVILRRYWSSTRPTFLRSLGSILLVLLLAYITALMETLTISSVPYYTHKDRWTMYVIGSAFYALYFVISFPMFIRLDERPGECWTPFQSAMESLASAMTVFILCDFWRLIIGHIHTDSATKLPWM